MFFEEWDDPHISAIRWVSELVGIAGGDDCFPELAQEPMGKDRIIADGAEIVRRNPDIIFGSWCGKKFRPETGRGAARLGRRERGEKRAAVRDQVGRHPAARPGGADRWRGASCTSIIMDWSRQHG